MFVESVACYGHQMGGVIKAAMRIAAAGNMPKTIHEFVGLLNTGTKEVSVASMKSPSGWTEPGQTPEFDEYSMVLKGTLHVETQDNKYDIQAGQAFMANAGQWVRYSTPAPEGAEYIAVCMPAFAPENVHRDE